MKNKKGFSTIEVLISIVLMAVIVVFVARIVQFNTVMMKQTRAAREALYSAQNIAEEVYSKISASLPPKPGDIIPDKVSVSGSDELISIVHRDESDYGRGSYTILGVKVAAHEFSIPIMGSDGKVSFQISGGTADKKFSKPPEERRPVLDGLTIKASSNADVVYFAEDDLTVQTDKVTGRDLYKVAYQWYASTSPTHSIVVGGMKPQNDNASVKYPGSFDIIGGVQENIDYRYMSAIPNSAKGFPTIPELLEEYKKGFFLACTATPGSVDGYMGKTHLSNYIYISALPKLDTNYIALYDPSFLPIAALPNDTIKEVRLPNDKLMSEAVPGTASSVLSTSNDIALNFSGEDTSNIVDRESFYYSRFLRIDPNKSMVSAISSKVFTVYTVAKLSGGGNTIVSTSDNQKMTVGDACGIKYAPGEWYIYKHTFTCAGTSNTITIKPDGSTSISLAEMVIVNGSVSTEDDKAVQQYLSTKYGIQLKEPESEP